MGGMVGFTPQPGLFHCDQSHLFVVIYRALRANMPQRVVGLEAAAGEGLIDQLKETLTVVIPL
jgi:hypothetical protein